MGKFKVGDLVRRIANQESYFPLEIGSVHLVVGMHDNGHNIKLEGDPHEAWRDPDLFELHREITCAADMDKLYA